MKSSNQSVRLFPLWTMALESISWLLGLVDQALGILRFFNGPSIPKFFAKGWGDLQPAYQAQEACLKQLEQGDATALALSTDDLEWSSVELLANGAVTCQQVEFTSPLADVLPKESRKARFLLVEPANNNKEKAPSPPSSSSSSTYIVMLPATGEMGKRERLALAKQFATTHGWKSIIVTAPFYGKRKPSSQTASLIETVGNVLLQSQAIVQETAMIIKHILVEPNNKDDDKTAPSPLQGPSNQVLVTGFSWGSAMSSISTLLALMHPQVDGRRLGCVAYIGSASPVPFADGILSHTVDWQALLDDLQRPGRMQTVLPDECDTDGDNNIAVPTTTAQVQQLLGKEFSKTTLQDIVDQWETIRDRLHTSSTNDARQRMHPAVVRVYCARHDGFLLPKYSKEYIRDMERIAPGSGSTKGAFDVTWLPGGHCTAAMMRPVYHKRAIEEAVQHLGAA